MAKPSIAPAKKKWHPAIKIAIGLVFLAVVVVLFFRSVNDARAEPYTVRAAQLAGWTVEPNAATDETGALVSLRPPKEMSMDLFRQLFSRHMESLSTPTAPGIALVLRSEIHSGVSADDLLSLARSTGLGQVAATPKCVATRRISEPGITRQVYFLWFDVPGFDQFRQAVASVAGPGFAAKGLSTVLLIGAQPDFKGWMPIVVDQERDCTAPVSLE